MDMGARLHTETVHGCILPEYRFIKKEKVISRYFG